MGLGFRFISKDGEFIETLDVKNLTEEQTKKILTSKHFLGELFPEGIEFADATRFSEGYAAVSLGKAWIFVDKQLIPRGNNENPIFENALPFSNGLAGIKLNGKFGYINKGFNLVIPCKYDSCAIAGKNLCRVYGGRKNKYGYSIISYIDRKGNIIWQNINYEVNNRKKETRKSKHDWRDFDYSYIGKNYLPLFIIIPIMVIIAMIIIASRRHKKKSASDKEKMDVNTDKLDADKLDKPADTLISEPKMTNEDNQSLKNNEFIPNIDNDSRTTEASSVDERLDDLLKL